MSISILITQIRDYLHSLYFCLKVFPFREAIKVPVNIAYQVKIGNIFKGAIELHTPIVHNQVYIGHQGYSAIAEQPGLINIENGGRLVIKGTARFAQGVRIWVDQDATITVGNNFYCNKNCLFRAYDNIIIGEDVLMGWDIEINTTDGHLIFINGIERKPYGPIRIGNNNWIGAHVIISKNVLLSDNTVVAQNSLVNKSYDDTHIIVGGVPAKILKKGIIWLK